MRVVEVSGCLAAWLSVRMADGLSRWLAGRQADKLSGWLPIWLTIWQAD
jgi:hypothetical protein